MMGVAQLLHPINFFCSSSWAVSNCLTFPIQFILQMKEAFQWKMYTSSKNENHIWSIQIYRPWNTGCKHTCLLNYIAYMLVNFRLLLIHTPKSIEVSFNGITTYIVNITTNLLIKPRPKNTIPNKSWGALTQIYLKSPRLGYLVKDYLFPIFNFFTAVSQKFSKQQKLRICKWICMRTFLENCHNQRTLHMTGRWSMGYDFQ